jgi:hypothetical protein
MKLVLTLPLIVALVGLVVFVVTAGKPSRLGEISFFAGLLAFLLNVR